VLDAAQRPARRAVGERCRDGTGIAVVLTGDHLEAGAHVGHVAGHRTVGEHELRGDAGIFGRNDRGRRHQTGGGLDRGDAAAGGGVAQRAADVVAEPERAHARRQG
jgi:hypothetical protein